MKLFYTETGASWCSLPLLVLKVKQRKQTPKRWWLCVALRSELLMTMNE